MSQRSPSEFTKRPPESIVSFSPPLAMEMPSLLGGAAIEMMVGALFFALKLSPPSDLARRYFVGPLNSDGGASSDI